MFMGLQKWTIVIFVGVLLACQPIAPAHSRRPIAVPENKLGIHLLLDDGRNQWPVAVWPEHLDYARQAVGELAEETPPHPLVAKGFLSVGCMPCTSRSEAGEDARAGRWRGRAKTECGIHTTPTS